MVNDRESDSVFESVCEADNESVLVPEMVLLADSDSETVKDRESVVLSDSDTESVVDVDTDMLVDRVID